MTNIEFRKHSVDLFKAMMKMRYDIELIEIVGNLVRTFSPKEPMETAVLEFKKIAEMQLPEDDFHLEISKKWKELQRMFYGDVV